MICLVNVYLSQSYLISESLLIFSSPKWDNTHTISVCKGRKSTFSAWWKLFKYSAQETEAWILWVVCHNAVLKLGWVYAGFCQIIKKWGIKAFHHLAIFLLHSLSLTRIWKYNRYNIQFVAYDKQSGTPIIYWAKECCGLFFASWINF